MTVELNCIDTQDPMLNTMNANIAKVATQGNRYVQIVKGLAQSGIQSKEKISTLEKAEAEKDKEIAGLKKVNTILYGIIKDRAKKEGDAETLKKLHEVEPILQGRVSVAAPTPKTEVNSVIHSLAGWWGFVKDTDRDIAMAAVSKDGLALWYSSADLRNDREVVLAAVRQNGKALKYASADLKKDREIVLAAVEQKGYALKYASADLKNDRGIVMAAVKQDGLALQYASEELKNDPDIVLAAMSQNVHALQYASAELRKDRKFITDVMAKKVQALQYASEDLRKDREFVLAAISQNIEALRYASEDLRKDRKFILVVLSMNIEAEIYLSTDMRTDREVVLAIVSKNGQRLSGAGFVMTGTSCYTGQEIYVGADLTNDREIVLAAVTHYGLALQHASEALKKDREIVLAAVLQNGLALQYASEDLRKDREVVLAAVSQDGMALWYAGEELKKDREVVLAAVSQNGLALQYAHADLRKDREIILAAVSKKGKALLFAHADLRKDREIVLTAVSKNGEALKCAGEELKKDREIVLTAVSQDGSALQYASEELKKDREIVLAAVSQNGLALQYASEDLRKDLGVVVTAILQKPEALQYAGEALRKELSSSQVSETDQAQTSKPVQARAAHPAFVLGQPGVGIRNGGDTCFMNAALQAIQADGELGDFIAERIGREALYWTHLSEVAAWLASPLVVQQPQAAVLNSLVYLFSIPNFQPQANAFRQYAQQHGDDAAAVAFSQAVMAAINDRQQGQAVARIQPDALNNVAPLLATIAQEAVLREAVLDAARREKSRILALSSYPRFHQAYRQTLEESQVAIDGNLTMAPFRALMPLGDENGQQDADAFFSQLIGFLDPVNEAVHRKFFHRYVLRKHYVELNEQELIAAARIGQEFQNVPPEVQKARVQLQRLAVAREVLAAHVDEPAFIEERWATMGLNGWMQEERANQYETGIDLPNSQEVLSGQNLFNQHFEEDNAPQNEPAIRRKQDGSLALFSVDRQQEMPLAQLQDGQRLVVRLNRFYSEFGPDIVGRPMHIPRRKNNKVDMPLTLQVSGSPYELHAVVCHYGASAGSGHYTAVVKAPQDGEWWLFNDGSVRTITLEERNRYVQTYGYLNFYRKSPQQQM